MNTLTKRLTLLLVAIAFASTLPINASAQSVSVPGIPDITLPPISVLKTAIDADKVKTSVVQSVPTSDTNLEAKESGIKIFGLDIGVSWNELLIEASRKVLNQVVNSTISWMNTGFNGSPAFVTDPGAYFGGLANGISGDFIKNSNVGFLCSPLQNADLKLSLQRIYTQAYQPQCTLTGIAGNINNFYDRFSSGGWGTFIQMTQEPANNPYGSFVDAQVELQSQIASALGVQKQQLDWAQGFKSQGECILYNGFPSTNTVNIGGATVAAPSTYNTAYPPGGCIDYGPIQTPGATIKAHLDAILPANDFVSQLTTADQFDKLLNALGDGILQRFVSDTNSGGLLGKASRSSSGNSSGGTTGGTQSTPDLSCSPSLANAVVGDSVTWTFTNNNSVTQAVDVVSWSGDDAKGDGALTGTTTTASIAYTTDGTKSATVTASTTQIDELGNFSGPSTRITVQCGSVLVAKYKPLQVVSCTPDSLTNDYNAPVTWTAKITGGSGNIRSVQWTGDQPNPPNCKNAVCVIPIFPPAAPPTSGAWPFELEGGKSEVTLLNFNKDSATGILTSTLTREYFKQNNNLPLGSSGNVSTNITVVDQDKNVLPAQNVSCGSVFIRN